MAKKTKLEMAIVNKVIAWREKKKYSQNELAKVLKLSKGFIGQIESPNSPSKYSFNQLNWLAYKFGCSLHDFIPAKPIKEDDWEK
jgi:transcriptional regulator with XRE-family HTH domain